MIAAQQRVIHFRAECKQNIVAEPMAIGKRNKRQQKRQNSRRTPKTHNIQPHYRLWNVSFETISFGKYGRSFVFELLRKNPEEARRE